MAQNSYIHRLSHKARLILVLIPSMPLTTLPFIGLSQYTEREVINNGCK